MSMVTSSCGPPFFPQGHEPVSCDHLRQWMSGGGFYINMSRDTMSEHLAQLISKKCPNCAIQIERNEGCMQ